MAKDTDKARVEIETQTEKPGNEDKETGITQEELHELAEKECRETQVRFHRLNNLPCQIWLYNYLTF